LLGITVFLVIASFSIVRLIPGDPAVKIAGLAANGATIEKLKEQLGLNRSYTGQFEHYISGLFSGDFGKSFQTGQPVSSVIVQNAGFSLRLAGASLLVVFVFGGAGGLLAAHFTRDSRHRGVDLAFTGVTGVVGAVPDYLLATVLTAIFAVWFRLLPVSGTGWEGIILPILALAIPTGALLMRVVRAETLNVLSQDYVRAAEAKRLPTFLIYRRHVIPNVVTGALTIAGILFSTLIGGAVVVENVFARPGLGSVVVNAVTVGDYPVIQIVILVLGITVAVVNTVVDITLGLLDPRSQVRQA
jgi:peptide/nickel transport system permease protein